MSERIQTPLLTPKSTESEVTLVRRSRSNVRRGMVAVGLAGITVGAAAGIGGTLAAQSVEDTSPRSEHVNTEPFTLAKGEDIDDLAVSVETNSEKTDQVVQDIYNVNPASIRTNDQPGQTINVPVSDIKPSLR